MYNTFFEQNKKLWNSRVDGHFKSDFYDVAGFRNGKTSLQTIELEGLAHEVPGKTLLHLQCHFGQDTLSWERLGATVTGVDFSDKAIETARSLTEELGMNARFIEANIYDLPDVLDEQFDIVFCSYGGIPWLPDMDKWAAIVGRFLKKDGIFYLAEFHPTFYLFNFENYKVEYSYFTDAQPYKEDVQGSYAEKDAPKETEYFWNHSLHEVIMPLLNEGLNLLEIKEFDYAPYNCFENMEEREPGKYVWGKKLGVRLPHIFSLKMKKS